MGPGVVDRSSEFRHLLNAMFKKLRRRSQSRKFKGDSKIRDWVSAPSSLHDDLARKGLARIKSPCQIVNTQ